ncbi:peptidoglycan recognition protein 4-like [Macrosteles quadrilineatus]|uniref:peptidoglycan recognition protein 4-like n=1 Tax=Macrosteles quadrilineatus TaxID=74068 RepID=UPI0023E17259|nr:peptidoglycan recognition protein 4-like [Macrosteles quadrilineatus]
MYYVQHSQRIERPGFRIISRDEWGAVDPLWVKFLALPVQHVFFEYTNTDECTNREECMEMIRIIQRYNLKLRSNPDIRYNFLIASDGTVYEGRGWDSAPRLPQKYSNVRRKALYVALIGNYIDTMDRTRLKFEPATFTPLQREAWEAESPRGQLDYLTDPVTAVFCGLRTNSKGCSHTDHCKMLMRDMQRRDMEAGLPDIRYNFCIGGDGEVYEGRGWASRPSLPSRYSKWVSHSLYIAFVGPLTAGGIRPSQKMVFHRNLLVEAGLRDDIINRKFMFILLYKI